MQAQPAGALQQRGIGRAQQIIRCTKCTGVVEDACGESERRRVPLRRQASGGAKLHVTAGSYLGEQRGEWSRHSSSVGSAGRATLRTVDLSIHGREQNRRSGQGKSRYASTGACSS